jgi:hypothetical protein
MTMEICEYAFPTARVCESDAAFYLVSDTIANSINTNCSSTDVKVPPTTGVCLIDDDDATN